MTDLIEYTVLPGDTFYSISRKFNVSPELLRLANPEIVLPDSITVGLMIRIPYSAGVRKVINVNGFTCCDIPTQALNERLPYLSWLSPLSYIVQPDGTLIAQDDTALIQAAREAGVGPMMVISNTDETGAYSTDLAHAILISPAAQYTLLNETLRYLQAKEYYGLIIDFEYIEPADYGQYANFLQAISERLRVLGYITAVTVRLNAITQQRERLNEAIQYIEFARFVNYIIIMNNECLPADETMLDELQDALEYATNKFSSQILLLGMPNCCNDWQMISPTEGIPRSLSLMEAGALRQSMNVEVQFDPQLHTPYFEYIDVTGVHHVICSNGVEGVRETLQLIDDYNLCGPSYWKICMYTLDSFQATAVMFEIRKPLAST